MKRASPDLSPPAIRLLTRHQEALRAGRSALEEVQDRDFPPDHLVGSLNQAAWNISTVEEQIQRFKRRAPPLERKQLEQAVARGRKEQASWPMRSGDSYTEDFHIACELEGVARGWKLDTAETLEMGAKLFRLQLYRAVQGPKAKLFHGGGPRNVHATIKAVQDRVADARGRLKAAFEGHTALHTILPPAKYANGHSLRVALAPQPDLITLPAYFSSVAPQFRTKNDPLAARLRAFPKQLEAVAGDPAECAKLLGELLDHLPKRPRWDHQSSGIRLVVEYLENLATWSKAWPVRPGAHPVHSGLVASERTSLFNLGIRGSGFTEAEAAEALWSRKTQ